MCKDFLRETNKHMQEKKIFFYILNIFGKVKVFRIIAA